MDIITSEIVSENILVSNVSDNHMSTIASQMEFSSSLEYDRIEMSVNVEPIIVTIEC